MPEKGVYSSRITPKKFVIHSVFLHFFGLSGRNLRPFQVLRSFEMVTFLIKK